MKLVVAARGSQEVGFAQPLGEKFSLRSTSIYHRVAGRSGGLRFGSLYIFPTCYVNFVKKNQLTVQRTIFLKFYQITITNLDSDEDDDDDQMEGYWQRRRRLDGALNRVPHGFYTKERHSMHSIVVILETQLLLRYGRSWRNASRSECKQPTLCSTDSLRR